MKRMRKLLFIGAVFCMLLQLSACGKQVEVSIQDGYVETVVSVNEDAVVKDAIEAAELTFSEDDQIEPALDEKVSGEDTKIVISRHACVTLTDDGNSQEITLVGGKVKDALDMAGVSFDNNDLINYDEEVYLKDGMEIQIIRRQQVKLVEGGRQRKILTTAKTVEEFLELEGIRLDKKDRITPKLSKSIEEGMKINLQRVTVKSETVTETIPYETETSYSDSMYKGTQKVTREGVNGEKEVVYEITFVNGKEESRKKVEEKILKNPVNKKIIVGNKSKTSGKTVVSKQKVYDCDGSGHGYYIITYSDGSMDYKEF